MLPFIAPRKAARPSDPSVWAVSALTPLLALGLAASCSGTPGPVPGSPTATASAVGPTEPEAAEVLHAPSIWKTAAEVSAACEQHLARAARLRDELVAASPPGLDNVLLPMNGVLTQVDRVLALAELMAAVHPDEGVRDAAEKCQQDAQKFTSELELDREVYDGLAAIDTGAIPPDAQRFLGRLLRDYRRAGVDRDAPTRQKLAKLQEEMVKLGQDYRRAIRDDRRSIKVTRAQLAGLPQDYIDKHEPGQDGKLTITTDYTDLIPLLKYAHAEDVRRALFKEFLNRAHPTNGPVLKKLLERRHEYATTLGFANWAAYNAGDKMLDTEAKVAEFIDRVAGVARPRVEGELVELLARKKQDDPRADGIKGWDRFYYVIKLQKERFGVDAQKVRTYFDYPRVKQGLLDINQALFGVTFQPVPDAPVWHPSVQAYDVLEGAEPIARFYLDMHPREDKFGHAASFSMYSGVEGSQHPSATLVCNFPEPSASGPALMEHGDVVTFFHEFGHLMHHLLSGRQRWVNLSAYNVEWDFVEVPSQLMEEWAWTPEVLQGFAKHHQTNEAIPVELARKMRAADEFGKGVHVMRQMYLAALSLEYHRQDPSKLDLLRVVQDMHEKYSPYDYEKGTHFFANFGHLEGYSSAYYTYMWSLVLVRDMLTRFEKAGMMDPPTALAYRQAVLQPGAAADAMDMVERFLGRPYQFAAFQAWLERK